MERTLTSWISRNYILSGLIGYVTKRNYGRRYRRMKLQLWIFHGMQIATKIANYIDATNDAKASEVDCEFSSFRALKHTYKNRDFAIS